MNLLDYVTHPQLAPLVKNIRAKDYLFRQGQTANSMIFIISGQAELIGEDSFGEFYASRLEAGDFLGEKAITQDLPFQRAYAVRATTDLAYLEITRSEFSRLEAMHPELISQLLKGLLQVIGHRFDLTLYLTRILRSSNNLERLIHVILYLTRSTGRKFPGGVVVLLSPETIHHYIDMDILRIRTAISHLVAQRILILESPDHYLIPNLQLLSDYLPYLVRDMAA